MNGVPILTGLAEASANRKAWFCDVWGVLYDGLEAIPSAVEACRAFRRRGGEVVLVSNSPRPSPPVLCDLQAHGLPHDCYDAAVTSGDVTRSLVEAYAAGPLFHIGPERDLCLFDGLAVQLLSPSGPVRSARPAPADAVAIVCTGFIDEDNETAEDYEALLTQFAARGITMICANPDLVVERGMVLMPCSGLLAKRYAELGQTVIQAGKPYAPIYEAAMRKLSRPLPRAEVLAIGDGIHTDIAGAAGQGIDAIYIASRVNLGGAAETELTPEVLAAAFAGKPFRPAAAMPRLRW